MDYSQLSSQHLPGGTKENHVKFQSLQAVSRPYLNQGPSK